jgi:GNAT superfamily N-acetyltransferase
MSEHTMTLTIRAATTSDTKALLELVHKLATYEKKKPAEIALTAEKIMIHGFNTQPYFHILVAEANQELVGYALYFFTYAASAGAPILYLEDLFVMDEHRKQGIGTQILSELAKIAKNNNCCRMEWHAFTWNNSVINFYKSLGAMLKTDLVQVRLEKEAMTKLAESARKIDVDQPLECNSIKDIQNDRIREDV